MTSAPSSHDDHMVLRSQTTDGGNESSPRSHGMSSEIDQPASSSHLSKYRMASRLKSGQIPQPPLSERTKGAMDHYPTAYSPIKESRPDLVVQKESSQANNRSQGFKERAAMLRSRYHNDTHPDDHDSKSGSSSHAQYMETIERQASSQRSSRRSSILGTPLASPMSSPRGEGSKDFLFPELPSQEQPCQQPSEEEAVVVEDMPIRVIVRKRPISKSELARGDNDCLEIQRHGTTKHSQLQLQNSCAYHSICFIFITLILSVIIIALFFI